MHVEIVLAALVMVVAILVAADFFRRTSAAPREYPAGDEQGPALDAGREAYPASRAGSAGLPSPPYEPATTAPPAGSRQDGARQASGPGTPAPSPDPVGKS